MNIDAKFFGAIIFVIVQTCGAIWWASGLSAEVERLAGIQGTAIPALEAEAKQCGIEIHNLKKLTGDQKEVQEAVKDLKRFMRILRMRNSRSFIMSSWYQKQDITETFSNWPKVIYQKNK